MFPILSPGQLSANLVEIYINLVSQHCTTTLLPLIHLPEAISLHTISKIFVYFSSENGKSFRGLVFVKKQNISHFFVKASLTCLKNWSNSSLQTCQLLTLSPSLTTTVLLLLLCYLFQSYHSWSSQPSQGITSSSETSWHYPSPPYWPWKSNVNKCTS